MRIDFFGNLAPPRVLGTKNFRRVTWLQKELVSAVTTLRTLKFTKWTRAESTPEISEKSQLSQAVA